MNERNIWRMVRALLTSRKFWVSFLAAVAGGILYARGEIDAGGFADMLVTLAIALAGAIAFEDGVGKAKGGDSVQ